MNKIVFCDIDGTITSEVNSISKEVKNMLNSNSLEFVLATGRNIKHAKELNLDVPIISSNGAQINDSAGNIKIIAGIKEEVLTQIINDIRAYNYVFVVSCEHGNIIETHNDSVLEDLYGELAKLHPDMDHELGRDTYREVISQKTVQVEDALVYLKENNLKALKIEIFSAEDKRTLGNLFNKYPDTYAYSSHVCNYEITPSNVSKAEGIKAYLKDRTDYKVYAIGDSSNDIEMFKYADMSFAMGNGIDDLKSIADYVVPSVEEDGFLAACALILND